MNVIDQNSAVTSLNQALVPGSSLIDGRTESDRLSFLCDFASLINFYDSDNTVNGNWSPFLFKDPVFLLASIAHTPFSKYHSRYINTCFRLEQIFDSKKDAIDQSLFFNQLFHELTQAFKHIERWTSYMQRSPEEYDLKRYVLHQVKTNFSGCFWAILSLRESLSLSSAIQGIKPPHYSLFESFDERIWKQSRDKDPYWDVLGIGHPVVINPISMISIKDQEKANALLCLSTLTKAGDGLFDFFQTIITHAATELEKLKAEKSRYPDTTLLRTFVNLLKVQQDQLNGISTKHLEFYYKDILKQAELPAQPDHVFVCAEFAKPGAAFPLPSGTLLDGGLDAQKNPVWFATQEDASLNPAAIISATTVSRIPASDTLSSLYMQTTPTPGVLQKDENGNILSWETFGGSTLNPATLVKTGIAFASPMLLLREGNRTIMLELGYTGELDIQMLSDASYYLSTQTAWYEIKKNPVIVQSSSNTAVTIEIQLDASQPAIESFLNLQNPDGFNSTWPMLKIEFNSIPVQAEPPVLNQLKIQVTVTNVKTFQLYNDSGMLSTKTPYPLFGTTPVVNSSFIIGSNEVFSKPLDSLYVELDWDKWPDNFNFQTYYQQYNNYIASIPPILQKVIPPQSPVATSVAQAVPSPAIAVPEARKKIKDFFKRIVTRVANFFKRIIGAIVKFFKPIIGPMVKFFKPIINWIIKLIKGIVQFVVKLVKGIVNLVVKLITGIVNFVVKVVKVIGKFLAKLFCPPIDPAGNPSNANAPNPFNNVCFTVSFDLLQDHSWNQFDLSKQSSVSVSATNEIQSKPYENNSGCIPAPGNGILLFSTTSTKHFNCILTSSSYFAYGVISSTTSAGSVSVSPSSPPPAPPAQPKIADPTIQLVPLKFSDTSASGFMKIVLSGTSYGFGSQVYPNVVAWIALQNALAIAKKEPVLPQNQPANLPFAPKLANFTVHYTALQTYNLNSEREAYPVQCFLYSPFENFMVYDNSTDLKNYKDNFVTSITGSKKITQGIPLFPSFKYSGALFLEVSNLVPSNVVNLYFELARNYGAVTSGKKVHYHYLSKTGWKKLSVLSDGTNNFSCSGIIKVNVPDDISNIVGVMPGTNNWLSIAVTDSLSSFAQTVFLKTNGVEAQRSGTTFLTDTTAPNLAAGSITKPLTAIPQIAALVQPFASFGGKPAESQERMNQRVSNRLKTKDRAVSAEDYYRLVRQEYPDIYYSKMVYHPDKKETGVYLVKAYGNLTDANAFIPMITECKEEEIQLFLTQRASAFAAIRTANFDLQYVRISAGVIIKTGYESQGMQKNINQALNIFLSPWIASTTQQLVIDQGISDWQVADFIKSMDGVSEVESVSFTTWIMETVDGPSCGIMNTIIDLSPILPTNDWTLFVSSMDHDIQCTPVK